MRPVKRTKLRVVCRVGTEGDVQGTAESSPRQSAGSAWITPEKAGLTKGRLESVCFRSFRGVQGTSSPRQSAGFAHALHKIK
ncbi:hypothetical protein [Hydrogenimonas sp.]